MATIADDPVHRLELAEEALDASDLDAAAAHLSAAIRGFTATGDRRRAALLVELVRLHDRAGNRAAAKVEAARAAAALAGLDVVLPAGDAALLERWGVGPPAIGTAPPDKRRPSPATTGAWWRPAVTPGPAGRHQGTALPG